MSTSTSAANAKLSEVLTDSEVLSVTKSKAVELSEKMFQSYLISDSMMDQFSSLDHARVEPQLLLKYLFRLLAQRIQQDDTLGPKSLGFLQSWGEQPLCELLRRKMGEEQLEGKVIGSEDYLKSNDISWISEALVEASPEWENLAIALGLSRAQRLNIKGDDNLKKLVNLLDGWLAGVNATPPTIDVLVRALRSKLVGHSRLAKEIEKQFEAAKMTDKASYIKPTDFLNSSFMIVHQSPRRVEVEDGKSTLLLVQASQRENVSYQWNKNGQPLADGGSYVANQPSFCGVHDNLLIINHAHQGTGGEYTCQVRSKETDVVSNKVTLTVLHTPEKKTLLDLYSINPHIPLEGVWPPVESNAYINIILTKWSPPSTDFRLNDLYPINEDTDEILYSKQKIEHEEVFGSYSRAALILIEGRPGSGKTTLLHKLVKDWAEGNVLVCAKLVFLVSLRMLCNDVSQEDNLFSILKLIYNDAADLRAVIANLERNNGEGVCFVFDGLDEYRHHVKDQSVVCRLLRKTYLPKAMIIVSSRPGAMTRLQPRTITLHMEVFGFTKNQVSEYIDKFPFGTSSESTFGPSNLKEYLSLHPNVLRMCYLPIHTAIICFVFKIMGGHLPHTQTKIYKEFTRAMILRHLKRESIEMELFSLEELPGKTSECFNKLCHLAFIMTVELKQVINAHDKDFPFIGDAGSCGDWSLGLLTCIRTTQLSGVTTSYMFLHLTLQEFLAAYYIANEEEKKTRQLIRELRRTSNLILNNLWTFYFGLKTFTAQTVRTCREILKPPSVRTMQSIRYAFESQQAILCDEILRLYHGRIHTYALFSSDIPALVFVILNTTQPVTSLDLSFHKSYKVNLLQQIQHVKFPELKTLCTRFDANSVSDTRALKYWSMILGSSGNLGRVSFCSIDLTVEGGHYLAKALKCLTSLDYLELKGFFSTSTLIAGLEVAIIQLHYLTQLKMLHLSKWNLDTNLCEVLASTFCNLINLESLDLSNNKISPDGIIPISAALYHLTKLEHFDLTGNNIGPNGAIGISLGLSHLTKLTHLFLSGNGMDVQSALQVIIALKDCQELKHATINKSNTHSFALCDTFSLRDLVTKGDSATIDSLKAAVQVHNKRFQLDLGFQTILVKPFDS